MLKYAHKGFPRLPPNVVAPTTAAGLMEEYAKVDSVAIYKTEYESFYTMFNLSSNLDSSANTDYIQYALVSEFQTNLYYHMAKWNMVRNWSLLCTILTV